MSTDAKIRRFFQLIESFTSNPAAYDEVLHAEARLLEYPNAISPVRRERDRATAAGEIAGLRQLLREHRYEVREIFGADDRWAAEVEWTGTLAIDYGALKTGRVVKANLCVVFTLREGKIHRIANYDCYDLSGT